MPNYFESPGHGKAMQCAVCDGKFGLVRHYSWRTPLCSKKCVDRLRARRDRNRSLLPWVQVTSDQLPDDRARAL